MTNYGEGGALDQSGSIEGQPTHLQIAWHCHSKSHWSDKHEIVFKFPSGEVGKPQKSPFEQTWVVE